MFIRSLPLGDFLSQYCCPKQITVYTENVFKDAILIGVHRPSPWRVLGNHGLRDPNFEREGESKRVSSSYFVLKLCNYLPL